MVVLCGGDQGNPSGLISALADVFVHHAAKRPAGAALLGPRQDALNFETLLQTASGVIASLRDRGVGREDRVVVVTDGSVHGLAALLGVMAGSVCVPLDAARPPADLERVLDSLRPAAFVLDEGRPSSIRALAERGDSPILEIPPASLVSSHPWGSAPLSGLDPSGSSDIALVLCTSGTSGAPKLVAHSHRSLLWSASSLATRLRLAERTCALNVVPLFYSHGLVAVTLSSLVAGAPVVTNPTSDPATILDLVEEFQPTWFSTVPTVHHGLIACATRRGRTKSAWPFEFISSAGAPLTDTMRRSLEEVFSTPVIERYAMTESPVVACNGFAEDHRPGTVGRPAGCEVALLSDRGMYFGSETEDDVGEILVRGPGVMQGYADEPESTEAAFDQGWLRTGDIGHLDGDGFLSIRGRLKDQINRGGENISPLAVERVLADHAGVRSVFAFGVPHPTLGEEVVAAVIPDPGRDLSVSSLRHYAHQRLGVARTPKRVVLVDELPAERSGKVDRAVVAAQLRSDHFPPTDAPTGAGGRFRSALEAAAAGLMANVLELNAVGPDDDFFLLGGDSLQAVCLLVDVEEAFGRSFDLGAFVEEPTAAHLAQLLARPETPYLERPPTAVRSSGDRPPLFVLLTWDSNLAALGQLLPALAPDQPVYGLGVFPLVGEMVLWDSVEQAAQHLLSAIRSVQPHGPYLLCGRSFAGLVAYEIAGTLERAGETVTLLTLLDTWAAKSHRGRLWRRVREAPQSMRDYGRSLVAGDRDRSGSGAEHTSSAMRTSLRRIRGGDAGTVVRAQYRRHIARLQRRYRPGPTAVPVSLLRTRESKRIDHLLGWRGLFAGPWVIRDIPGTHVNLLDPPHATTVAEQLAASLDEATGLPPASAAARPSRDPTPVQMAG